METSEADSDSELNETPNKMAKILVDKSLLNSFNNRQDKSYQQHQQNQHTSQYLNSYQ